MKFDTGENMPSSTLWVSKFQGVHSVFARVLFTGDDEYFYKRPPADLSDGDDSSDDQHGTEFQQKWLQARVESCESVDDQDELPAVNPEMSLAS